MVSAEGSLPRVLFYRRAVLVFGAMSIFHAWGFRDILGSGMSFCMTGAGHRRLFHPCGRRGTFLRGGFGGHFSW